jgi:hypothetical protein
LELSQGKIVLIGLVEIGTLFRLMSTQFAIGRRGFKSQSGDQSTPQQPRFAFCHWFKGLDFPVSQSEILLIGGNAPK